MSEEKKPNGWIPFYDRGYVGIKDYDDNILITPEQGFTEIGELKKDVAIAKKGNRCYIIDSDGNCLCNAYDRLSDIGEGYFKAGIMLRQNDRIVVEYADTSFVYEILNAKGEVLCGRDKGYNYISEACDGEVSVAINGQCGIADIQGNVIMPLKYKYIQPMAEGLYLVTRHGEDNYWATIINRHEEVMIPASLQYRSICRFRNGVAVANQEGKWGLIDIHGSRISDFDYNFAEEWGVGYYKVEKGSKKNIMRPDGSVVLSEWYNDVFKVNQGFFIFGNTLRKSKDNPNTRYIRGVAHVNGDIIFPMIFERVKWLSDNNALYAEIGTKLYVLTLQGGIYDPEHSHLPKKLSINEKEFFEKVVNWTLPGLQFFYRDTDAPVVVEDTYHVGDIVRAGFFLDVSTKLLKPTTRTRFIIASAHAAMLCEIDGMKDDNPNIGKWNLCMFHFNSYFKVMDVYERNGVTQVFLLHIPPAAAYFLGRTDLNFIDEATGKEASLIDMARKSLDEKMTMEVHPRSLDKEWCERTAQPIGLDDEFYPLPLNPMEEPTEGPAMHMSTLIHKLAKDEDIDGFLEVEDNFPWNGVDGHVCEGCIYAKGIQGKGEGCGRLFQKSFRERYVKGRCEYRKEKLQEESEFERRKRWDAEKAKDTAEKQSDVFALRLLNEFVDEILNGDIDKIVDFDFSTISENRKYGDMMLARAPIVRAIMALAFADAWPGLNVDAINHYTYWCDAINHYQQLFGANILDQYFKGMQKFNPTPEQHRRAVKVTHMTYYIGNVWVLPSKASIGNHKDKFKGYVDRLLKAMYACMTEQGRVDKELKGILYTNRKLMVDYQGEDGFHKFIENMMLDDYVDETGKPKEVFAWVWSMMKDLDKETYFNAVDEYCSFMESFVIKRGKKIVERLKNILNNH